MLEEWAHYYNLEPFGFPVEDLWRARQMAAVTNKPVSYWLLRKDDGADGTIEGTKTLLNALLIGDEQPAPAE